MHSAESTRAGASEQSKQERFGLIVARVRHGHHRCVQACGSAIEKFVTCGMGRVFDRHAGLAREAADIHALDVERPRARRSEPLTKRFVFIRVATAKLVIEMRRARNVALAGRRHLAERQQQRHRVGAARQGHEHTGIRLK
jgi:hypothetical protein